MDKRQLLAAALAAAAAPAFAQGAARARLRGPALLTVTGAGVRPHRGPFDPVRDQMMGKQKLTFDAAHAFDFPALAALPAVTIRPTLEYDGKAHQLQGPLLVDVLRAAGVPPGGGQLAMRAIDGYAPVISRGDAERYRFIVATHLDGEPMALGGLGPLWALYDADRYSDMMAKPVDQRFAQCPWGLYHIAVQAG
jgi:hypothetical protein